MRVVRAVGHWSSSQIASPLSGLFVPFVLTVDLELGRRGHVPIARCVFWVMYAATVECVNVAAHAEIARHGGVEEAIEMLVIHQEPENE